MIAGRGLEEVSIGDYVLAGGELAAMVLVDACVRLLPGVMGREGSLAEESNPGLIHRAHCPVERAVDVDAAARSGHDRDFEPGLTAIDRRIEHAKISGEAA